MAAMQAQSSGATCTSGTDGPVLPQYGGSEQARMQRGQGRNRKKRRSSVQQRHDRMRQYASSAEQLHRLVGEDGHWSLKCIGLVVLDSKFDTLMNLVIVVNLAAVLVETDARAHRRLTGNPVPGWLESLSHGLLSVYIAEILARLYVWRVYFFEEPMRVFELAVVVVDVLLFVFEMVFPELDDVIPSAVVLRVFRLFRLSRALRLFRGVHELYIIVSGFICAMRVILYGCMIVFLVIIVFSVLCVEVLGERVQDLAMDGRYDECGNDCKQAFESVWKAFVTITQQCLIGDNWGTLNMPIINKHPWTLVLLVLIWMTINLAIMNLLLSAIVDSAAERRESDKDYKKQTKIDGFEDAKVQLKRLCAEIDQNGSNTLTFHEISAGYDSSDDFFELLDSMDVDKDDLRMVFRDIGEGAVTHDEFIELVYKLMFQESHSHLIMIKAHVQDIQVKLEKRLSEIHGDLISIMCGVKEVEKQTELLTSVSAIFDEVKRSISALGSPEASLSMPRLQSAHSSALPKTQDSSGQHPILGRMQSTPETDISVPLAECMPVSAEGLRQGADTAVFPDAGLPNDESTRAAPLDFAGPSFNRRAPLSSTGFLQL